MATDKIVAEISKPSFYTRVAFIALKTAQSVATEDPGTANHENRVAYANKLFRGEDAALLIASHVVASNGTIASTIENGSCEDVPDSDIEYALGGIWNARANASAAGA